LRPIPEAPPNAHRDAYVAKARRFFAAFDELPLSRAFPLHAPRESDEFDLVLVGSDEVWNLRHPWYGGEGLFYGDGLSAGRLASYAASFGNQSAVGGLEKYWSDRLTRFDAISVRDRNSQDMVASALGERPALVLDPVLQFSHLVPQSATAGRAPYALVYGHGFPNWLTVSVAQWARANAVQLISIGYDNPWADEQCIDVGPLEFAAMMAGASAVITNFFHGCVFALVNGKPFATAPTDYRFTKVRDLMAALGAEHHMVSERTSAADFNSLLASPLQPQITRNIAILRLDSNAYLDHVLA
jgi:hypothetical protein